MATEWTQGIGGESIYQLYCTKKLGSYDVGKAAKTATYHDRIGERIDTELPKDMTDAQLGMTRLGFLVCTQACVELAMRLFATSQWIMQSWRTKDKLSRNEFRNELYCFLNGRTSSPAVYVGLRAYYKDGKQGWCFEKGTAELYDIGWLYNDDASPLIFFQEDMHKLYGSNQSASDWINRAHRLYMLMMKAYEKDPHSKFDIDNYVKLKETKQFNGGIMV